MSNANRKNLGYGSILNLLMYYIVIMPFTISTFFVSMLYMSVIFIVPLVIMKNYSQILFQNSSF